MAMSQLPAFAVSKIGGAISSQGEPYAAYWPTVMCVSPHNLVHPNADGVLQFSICATFVASRFAEQERDMWQFAQYSMSPIHS